LDFTPLSRFDSGRVLEEQMGSWKWTLMICAVGLAVAAGSASAGTLSQCDAVAGNLVVNCGFETGDFTGWTQGGNLGATGVSSSSPYVNSGNYGAFLGPVGSDGTLSQTIVGGATAYFIQFALLSSGGTPNDFTVFWNGTDIGPDLVDAPAFVFTTYSYNVSGNAGANTLQFSFRQDPSYWGLDDVVVQGAVPEPGSLMLLGGGMAGLLAVVRRKKSR
jgi:hypothetical protein